jgi:subtilase family protein
VARSLLNAAATLIPVAALAVSLAGPATPASAAAHPRVAAAHPPVGATHPGATDARPGLAPACPPPRPGHARCLVLARPQAEVNAAIAAGVKGTAAEPRGWSPQAIEAAYKLPVGRASHQTVAVSIAFDTPKLGRYLATYRKHYHLPPCTKVTGCLKIVNQRGKASPLPHGGEINGWSVEATLDVSMISVACPHCHILVVEGDSDGLASLAVTENTAARLGASVISNSYGARESGVTQPLAKAYRHPGHTIVVSSGDTGFTAASFPANLASVTSVGGTALHRARTGRGWRETVWDETFGASGSGCSAYVAKPAWQHDTHCPGRSVADVAAVAANVPIYEQRQGGWLTVAGTSVAAPLIAGVYGLAGNAARLAPGDVYRHPGRLFDVTTGNNALFEPPKAACGDDYLCTAKRGYDAPTGLGTPHGTAAF